MIRTRFGTIVMTMHERVIDVHGNHWIVCTLQGMAGRREIHLGDLRADGGAAEIDAALKGVPEIEESAK